MHPMIHKCLLTLAIGALPLSCLAQKTDAEVVKVDRAQGKLTLKHAEIKSLDMPPMTMVFRVKDLRWLDGLAQGQRIKFDAEKLDGQYTVTALSKQP